MYKIAERNGIKLEGTSPLFEQNECTAFCFEFNQGTPESNRKQREDFVDLPDFLKLYALVCALLYLLVVVGQCFR